MFQWYIVHLFSVVVENGCWKATVNASVYQKLIGWMSMKSGLYFILYYIFIYSVHRRKCAYDQTIKRQNENSLSEHVQCMSVVLLVFASVGNILK